MMGFARAQPILRNRFPRSPTTLDQTGVDQQPVEPSGLRAAIASVEQPLAALENLILFGKRGIERQAGQFLGADMLTG
jgi:hypothetical protein